MGRPRIKIMDDSEKQPEIKKQTSKAKTASSSEDQTKIKSLEALETATKSDSEESSLRTEEANKVEGDVRRETQLAGPRATQKPQKPGKAKPRSKKYQDASQDLDRSKTYPVNEALDLVKKVSYSKFTGTLEAHINTSQTGIRGLVSLPFASGKKLKIAAFGKGAESSGADVAGSDELIEDINKGKVDFDLLITTPEWMPKLAKIARILGPRGLMPNPKNGTITEDLKKAVEGFQAGKTEYKTETKAPIIHLTLGKLNQSNNELLANIKTLVQTLGKTRVKKLTLAPTMGLGVKIDLSSLV